MNTMTRKTTADKNKLQEYRNKYTGETFLSTGSVRVIDGTSFFHVYPQFNGKVLKAPQLMRADAFERV